MNTAQNPDQEWNRLEWEIIQKPFPICDLVERGPLHPEMTSITVQRDSKYDLQFTYSGKINDFHFKDVKRTTQAGQIIPPQDIKAIMHEPGGSPDIVLKNAFLDGKQSTRGNFLEGYGSADRLVVQYSNKNIARTSIWLINGTNAPFGRSTARKIIAGVTLERIREGQLKSAVPELPNEQIAYSKDHLSICCGALSFILASVPDKFSQKELYPMVIEIQNNGATLSDDVISAYIEFLSFIFGRRFYEVGTTAYSGNDEIIFAKANSPGAYNLNVECNKPDHSPIRMNTMFEYQEAEKIIGQLCCKYVEYRKLFRLDDALLCQSLARLLPLQTTIPIYAMAFEIIVDAWFKSKQSPSGGVYLHKERYSEIIKDELQSLQLKLKDVDGVDRIISKIQSAYLFGSNEKIERRFFDEIQLEIGSTELKAMRERNKVIHGGRFTEEYQEAMNNAMAYETLLNRVILKLLKYEGKYVDYSTYGFPERDLNEPHGK